MQPMGAQECKAAANQEQAGTRHRAAQRIPVLRTVTGVKLTRQPDSTVRTLVEGSGARSCFSPGPTEERVEKDEETQIIGVMYVIKC